MSLTALGETGTGSRFSTARESSRTTDRGEVLFDRVGVGTKLLAIAQSAGRRYVSSASSDGPRRAGEADPAGPAAVAREKSGDAVGAVPAAPVATHASARGEVGEQTLQALLVGTDACRQHVRGTRLVEVIGDAELHKRAQRGPVERAEQPFQQYLEGQADAIVETGKGSANPGCDAYGRGRRYDRHPTDFTRRERPRIGHAQERDTKSGRPAYSAPLPLSACNSSRPTARAIAGCRSEDPSTWG